MAEELISVYMPTRNRCALMQAAIASVLEQTHTELELIVVDDGSSDATWSTLQAWSARDPRLRCLRNDVGGGAPAARNRAIRSARGAWITGIDDDDRFHPRRLAAFANAWGQQAAAGIEFSGLYAQDIYCLPGGQRPSTKPGKVVWQSLYFFNMLGNQVYTRTERLRDVGLYDEAMPAWQDIDLFIRLMRRHGPALLVDEGLYYFDTDERDDRISKSRKQVILSAFERLVGKHAGVPLGMRQALFLQVFGETYGFKPDKRDVLTFLRYGLNTANLKRFLALRRPGG